MKGKYRVARSEQESMKEISNGKYYMTNNRYWYGTMDRQLLLGPREAGRKGKSDRRHRLGRLFTVRCSWNCPSHQVRQGLIVLVHRQSSAPRTCLLALAFRREAKAIAVLKCAQYFQVLLYYIRLKSFAMGQQALHNFLEINFRYLVFVKNSFFQFIYNIISKLIHLWSIRRFH